MVKIVIQRKNNNVFRWKWSFFVFFFFLRDLRDQIDQLMYEIKGKSAVYQVYVIGKSVSHITINSITKEREIEKTMKDTFY